MGWADYDFYTQKWTYYDPYTKSSFENNEQTNQNENNVKLLENKLLIDNLDLSKNNYIIVTDLKGNTIFYRNEDIENSILSVPIDKFDKFILLKINTDNTSKVFKFINSNHEE